MDVHVQFFPMEELLAAGREDEVGRGNVVLMHCSNSTQGAVLDVHDTVM